VRCLRDICIVLERFGKPEMDMFGIPEMDWYILHVSNVGSDAWFDAGSGTEIQAGLKSRSLQYT